MTCLREHSLGGYSRIRFREEKSKSLSLETNTIHQDNLRTAVVKSVLNHIQLEIHSGEIGITEKVGSGKSSY